MVAPRCTEGKAKAARYTWCTVHPQNVAIMDARTRHGRAAAAQKKVAVECVISSSLRSWRRTVKSSVGERKPARTLPAAIGKGGRGGSIAQANASPGLSGWAPGSALKVVVKRTLPLSIFHCIFLRIVLP